MARHRHIHAVVVVDDDESGRSALVTYLHMHGMAAVGVRDGKEAIQLLERRPALCGIVVDRVMPTMSGVGLLEYLRTHRLLGDAAALVYSGDEVDDPTRRRLGVPAAFRKPADPDAIARALVEHCPAAKPQRPSAPLRTRAETAVVALRASLERARAARSQFRHVLAYRSAIRTRYTAGAPFPLLGHREGSPTEGA